MKKPKKEGKLLISPTSIYYPGSMLSRQQKREMENKGIKIKTRKGEDALFFPTFRVKDKKGNLAFVCKLKEETKPVLFVYHILNEQFVKKAKLMEGFRKLAKQNKWKMISASDFFESAMHEARQIRELKKFKK